MKKFLAFSVAASVLVASTAGFAASGPMPQGTFAIGAERITGVFHGTFKNDPFPGQNPPGDEADITGIELFGSGAFVGGGGNGRFGGTLTGGDSRNMFVIPRIGFDYFIIDGLSLGGSLTVLSFGYSDPNARPPDGRGSVTDFLFAPRVGYAYMFGDVVGIWPRGGLAYTHGSNDPDAGGGDSSHYFAFDIDVPLIIAPVKNFAFTVGPVFDITLGGSQTGRLPPPEYTRDASLVLFGLSAGVVGLL
jgi:hypothetical protein